MTELKTTLEAWLQRLIADVGGSAGTIHLHQDGGLRLGAAVNIPLVVRDVVAWVPSGKGMAGLALERNEPVQTCNLQEDRSGDVKPGAKAVGARAAIAIPVHSTTGEILAVVGLAYHDEREIQGEQLADLRRHAASVVTILEP